MAIAPAARKALAGLDRALPLNLVESYAQLTHEKLTGLFYVAALIGFDALIALLLSAVGIFGVMANLVGERTREIGVRLAMGARREDVLKMIFRRAGWLTGTGVCIGLVLAFALAHSLANLIRDVSPNDPAVFSGITGACDCSSPAGELVARTTGISDRSDRGLARRVAAKARLIS
jgi:putative ABC transport system permease protein